jgi:hypothetical protein
MCIRTGFWEPAHSMNKPFLRARQTIARQLYIPIAW